MKRLQADIRCDLNIYTVEKIKAKLCSALNQCNRLAINLSGVTDLDSAGLQLLVALKNESLRQNKTIEYHSGSASVLNALQVFKLDLQLISALDAGSPAERFATGAREQP